MKSSWQRKSFVLISSLCLLVAGACTSNPRANESYSPEVRSLSSGQVQHLVFIGLDGWGGYFVDKADMPTVKRFMSGGASSLDMRCEMPSNSITNWPAIFFGRLKPKNVDIAAIALDSPSIFTLLEKSTGKNVFFFEWDVLENMCTKETTEKITISSNIESARKIASYIIEKKPAFIAIAFDQPDGTGHAKRWGSPEYYAKLTELDSYISIIEQAVKDAGIYDSTVFVLSSDHGGNFWGHGFAFAKQRKIPMVVYGRGIKSGYTIPSPLSIRDIAPTMAAIMALEIPSEWTGRPLTEIFE